MNVVEQARFADIHWVPGNVDHAALGATTVAGRAGGGGGTPVVPAGAAINDQLGSLLPGVVPGVGPVSILTVLVGSGQQGVGVRVGVAVPGRVDVGGWVRVAVVVLVGKGGTWIWMQDSSLLLLASLELVTAAQF